MNANPQQQTTAVPSGLGGTLRALREARRVDLTQASARLKFSVRQLQALESEDWERLPAGVALRGLVKNYGRFLETDVDSLMVMLDAQVGPTSPVAAPMYSVRATPLAPSDLSLESEPVGRPWGWLLIILVFLGVAGFYAIERGWVPDSWLVFDWLKSLKS